MLFAMTAGRGSVVSNGSVFGGAFDRNEAKPVAGLITLNSALSIFIANSMLARPVKVQHVMQRAGVKL